MFSLVHGFWRQVLGVCVAWVLVLAASGCAGNATRTEQVAHDPAFFTTPPAALPSGAAVKPGLTYTYKPLTTSVDKGVTLTLTLASGPLNATFDGETLAWTPQLHQANTTGRFTLNLTSSTGRTVSQTWTVPVGSREAPSGVSMTARSTGSPTEFHPFVWSLGFTDDDPGSVVVSASVPNGMTYDPSNRNLTWVPPGGSAGEQFVELDLVNNVGQPTHFSSRVAVSGNGAPTLSALSAPASANVGSTYVLTARILDPNGDSLKASNLEAAVTTNNQPLSPSPSVVWDAINMIATVSWPVPLDMEGQSVSLKLQATDPFGALGSLSQTVSLTSKAGPVVTALPQSPLTAVPGTPVTVSFSVLASPGNTIDPASITSFVTDPYNQVLQPAPSVIWNAATKQATSTWTPVLANVGLTINLNLRAAYLSGVVGSGSHSITIQAQPVPTITVAPGAPSSALVGYPVTVVFVVLPSPGRLIDVASLSAKATDPYGQTLTPHPTVTWDATTNRASVTWVPGNSAKDLSVMLTLSAANAGGGVAQAGQQLGVTLPPTRLCAATGSFQPTDWWRAEGWLRACVLL